MREAFHEQLDRVNDELVEMTRLVGSAMNRATQALLDADLALAESVIAGDDADRHARQRGRGALLRRLAPASSPWPTDLRIVVGALRIASSLERMGDLAEHVAKQARLRYPASAVPAELRATFAEMGAPGRGDRLQDRRGRSPPRTSSLAADIARTTRRWTGCTASCSPSCCRPRGSHGVEAAIDVTLLSRYYERYADHAVTIARRVVTS